MAVLTTALQDWCDVFGECDCRPGGGRLLGSADRCGECGRNRQAEECADGGSDHDDTSNGVILHGCRLIGGRRQRETGTEKTEGTETEKTGSLCFLRQTSDGLVCGDVTEERRHGFNTEARSTEIHLEPLSDSANSDRARHRRPPNRCGDRTPLHALCNGARVALKRFVIAESRACHTEREMIRSLLAGSLLIGLLQQTAPPLPDIQKLGPQVGDRVPDFT